MHRNATISSADLQLVASHETDLIWLSATHGDAPDEAPRKMRSAIFRGTWPVTQELDLLELSARSPTICTDAR